MFISLPVIRTAIAIVWGNWVLIDASCLFSFIVQVEFDGFPELA